MDSFPSVNNLIDLLLARAKLLKRIHFVKSSDQEEYLTFRDLYRKASQVLSQLQEAGMAPGDQLILQLEDNQEFLKVFWGCILGGIIPIPLNVGKKDEHKKKFYRVFEILDNPRIICVGGQLDRLKEFAANHQLDHTFTRIKENIIKSDVLNGNHPAGKIHSPAPQDTAFIQFSSGSTGDPKGVVLTHQNILDNIQASKQCSRHDSQDKMLSWMPLTHDMGLIGFHLNPLFCGMDHVIIPTELFIRRPTLWLDKATQHQSTILCSPNFGYSYLLKQLKSDMTYDWDLSHVRLLYNGAEPISMAICEDFLKAMEKYSLKSETMYPVYGLAEATLAVAFSGTAEEVSSLSVDKKILKIAEPVREVDAEDAGALTVVKVGTAGSYACKLRVVDDHDNPVEMGSMGHIQINGENVTAGYFNNAAANENLFSEDSWLKTGDLGFFHGKDFYVVGRSKDVIFVNGQNCYAHDVEATLIQQAELEAGKVAVTSTTNKSMQDVLLVFVWFKGKDEKFLNLSGKIYKILYENFDFENPCIIPVRQIPKTTSGKVERYRLAKNYEAGDFDNVLKGLQLLARERQPGINLDALNAVEVKLIDLWKSILGHEAFDLNESFFSTGGNSLKAGQLLQGIKRIFNVTITFEVLYDNPSIVALANLILSAGDQEKPLALIPKSPIANKYPATYQQQGLYYAWTLDQKSTVYNVPIVCKARGVIDPEKWRQAFHQLVNRHQVLNSEFRLEQEQLYFSIKEQQVAELEVVKQAKLSDSFFQENTQPFDLHEGPLFRAKLIHVNNGDWYFFFDVHHSVCDGISASLLMEELVALYHDHEVSPLGIEFADVAVWQQKQDFSGSEEFWEQIFDTPTNRLEFPMENFRQEVISFEGAKQTYRIDQNTTEKIKALAAKEGVSPFMLLFSVYSLLMSKYAINDDFVIAIPVSGRTQEQLNHTVGMLVNNLALRCTPQGNQPFQGFLRSIKSQFLKAFEHQGYPFEKVVEILKRTNEEHGALPVNTMFTYQHMTKSVDLEDFVLEQKTIDAGTAKFDLSFEIFELDKELELSIEYKTPLFERSEIDRIFRFYQHLLHQVISSINTNISSLRLIEKKELQNIIYGPFNQQKLLVPSSTIHDLFDEQAARTPDRIAISDSIGETKLSYLALKNRSNQLANHLVSEGIGTGKPVMVLMDQSPEFIIALVAVLKTGNHFVPVDTSLPSKRIAYIIDHSQTECLLSKNEIIAQIDQAFPDDLKVIDGSSEVLRKESTEFKGKGSLADPAYIIYTSGTTGTPKGVVVRHESLINYVFSAIDQYLDHEQVSFPLYTSISFDLTLTSVFVPLLSGQSIVTYPQKENEITISQIIEDNLVDVIKVTPTHLRVIKALPFFKSQVHRSKIRKFIVGGEQLIAQDARELTDLLGNEVEIYNEYGPTEATVGCMIHRYQKTNDHQAAVAIGKPFPNSRIYLLDKNLHPVPKGLSGELYIAGRGLAAGYLNDPNLTAKKFIPDPFHVGERMYKTGDLARMLPDGNLEFLDRIDRQTKVNGYRIELDEIESALLTLPEVKEAVVMVRQPQRNSSIVAYVVPHESKFKEAASLQEALESILPHYMVPRQIELIREIPTTRNGKVAYDQLTLLSSAPEAFIAPRNEIEKALWEVWKHVLGHENFGIKEKFYSLGGDSIKAIQVTSRLNNQHMELSVKDLLTFQTVEQVSKHVSISENLTSFTQGPINERVHLFPIHQWFFEQSFNNPHWYNQSVLLKFKKAIDSNLIAECFQSLIKHHDGFRLAYDQEKKCLSSKKNHDYSGFNLATFELNDWGDLVATCEQVRGSLHINDGPLIGIAILKFGKEERLFITIHHLLIDGISWRVLLEDFYGLYESKSQNSSFELPPKTAPLHLWHQSLSTYETEGLEEKIKGWNELTNDLQPIPLDKQDSNWLAKDSRQLDTHLNREQTRFLLNESQERFNVEPQVLMIVALLRSLKRVMNCATLLMEVESHGRHLEKIDVSRTIGWFTSLFPVKFTLSTNDLQNNIKVVKNQFQKGKDQGFSYSIWKYLNQNESQDHASEPADIRFNFLGAFQSELNNDLFEFDPSNTGLELDPENKLTAKLDVNCMIIHEELSLSITYHGGAHHQETINSLLVNFKQELADSLDHISESDDILLTTSDFDADMNQDELDSLFD